MVWNHEGHSWRLHILWVVSLCLFLTALVVTAHSVGALPVSAVQASPPINPPAIVVGHVAWQGRSAQPNPKQEMAVSLWLKLGKNEAVFPVENTDAGGYFTVTVGDLPRGTYDWRVKDADYGDRHATYLANAGTVKLGDGSITKVEMGTLKGGDTNNDNVVNMSDFVTVRRSFGPCSSSGCADSRADINNDNTVNVTDFNLIKMNFGQAGATALR